MIDETVSMVINIDIAVVRLLIANFTVKRDTLCPSQLSLAARQN